MYKYFQVNSDVGHYLVDKYNREVNPKREELVADLLGAVGAVGVVLYREWGMPATIQALVFPADHDICRAEGVKLTEHMQGMVVQFDNDSQYAGIYYEPISDLNQQLLAYPDFSDWVVHTMGVTRYALADTDGEAKKKIATYTHLLTDGRIIFAVPIGNVGQKPINPDQRMVEITKADYEAATQAQF